VRSFRSRWLSIAISAPARTRASTSAKLLAVSASEMWITWAAMARLYRHSSSPDSASKGARSAFCCASSFVGWLSAGGFFSSVAPGCVAVWICLRLRIDTGGSTPADRHRRVHPRAYRSLTMHLLDVTDIGPAFEHQRRRRVTDM
jgi:hypothetical protein